MNRNDIRFWVCTVCAFVDIVLAFALPVETQEFFLLCAACFALGAVISYVNNDQ